MHGLLMVGLGGAFGALLRYGAVTAMHRMTGAAMLRWEFSRSRRLY